jgi:beta-glucosidase
MIVGYRWYDYYNVTPKFAFGHGLSYTKFNYSSLQQSLVDNGMKFRFNVTNTGSVDGAEVAQVYLSPPRNATAFP